MKTAQQVAEQVDDKYKFQRQTPVGKAQQQVLDALGITLKLNGGSHANQIFDALGIVVSSRREGRSSVPVVQQLSVGGFMFNGEGTEDYNLSDGIDLGAIAQWM